MLKFYLEAKMIKKLSLYCFIAIILLSACQSSPIVYGIQELEKNAIRFVVFGDSTSAERENVEKVYGLRLSDKLRNMDFAHSIINSSISGSHTGSLEDNSWHNIPHALDRIQKDLLAYTPDFVIVLFGINDSWIDDTTKMQSRISLQLFEENMRKIIQKVVAVSPNLFLMTPNGYSDTVPKYQWERTEEYVEVLRRLAKEYKLELIDQWEIFSEIVAKEGDANNYLVDEVHPNDLWHERQADLIFNKIFKPF